MALVMARKGQLTSGDASTIRSCGSPIEFSIYHRPSGLLVGKYQR